MFCAEVRGSLRPVTPAEILLAQRISDLLWRLRRVPDAEAAIHTAHDDRRRAEAQQRYDRACTEHAAYCAKRATKKELPSPPP